MQVTCTKCSRPIAVTDIIDSNSGLLSHWDCKRPHGLTAVERALVVTFCWDHVVARCPRCNVSFHYMGLTADTLGGGGTNLCPQCRLDLTDAVRAHLLCCATVPTALRLRAQELRDAAQRLVKESHQLRDKSEVVIREAEAALFRAQGALREALQRMAAAS